MVERIFLHSSFRSGSTWFWARFRAAPGVCAFYEPFHEQKADLTPLALADDRADGWASGHPDLDAPYNLEYMPLLAPPKGVPFYRRRFAYEDYYATGQDPQEKAYIDFLVGHAERSGKRAVLGFKRSFGRLRRLKAQCGGVHLVTLRNPWDQWVSFAEQMQSSNHYFSFRIYLIACVANWSGHASFLEGLPLFSPTGDTEEEGEESVRYAYFSLPVIARFRVFLRVFLLDFLLAIPEADVVVDLDRLNDDAAYRGEMTETLRRVTGLKTGLHFDDCDLPRHWPSEDGAYRDALIEAYALMTSHPLAQGPAGAVLRGKLKEAIDWLGQPAWSPGQDASLPAAGERAEGFKSMGAVTLLLKLGDEAITAFDAAVRDDLEESEAEFSKARLMAELGRREAALAAYEAGLRLRPDHAPAQYNRGNLLLGLGRAAEAVGAYDRALRFRPSHANTHYNKGCALQDLHRFADAVDAYREAIAITPDFAEAHANLGNVLNELGRFAEAVDALDAALKLRADLTEAHFSRGLALQKLLRHEEALAAYDEVLLLHPDHAEAHGNRAVALAALRRLEEALEAFDTALGLAPDNAAALSDRGNVLKDLGRYEDALASYLDAQRLQPDLAAAHYNEAFPRLLLGELGAGLRKYEWRWRGGRKWLGERRFDCPQWLGDEVAGKTVLVHAEQGFGDSIQFCRYVPLLAARGARVVLQAPPALLRLFSGLEGVSALIADDQEPPEFDFHSPLMSLATAFGTELDSVPAAIPYLRAEPALEAPWRDRLAGGTEPKIGLVWAGSAVHPNDVNRSMPFSALAPLNSISGIHFCSLQGGQRQADLPGSWRDLAPHLDDFTETAAALSQLDLLITVDTASAHLAGALGRLAWVLLPCVPDWRWMTERSDSPWYPSLRLFRQSKRGDWAGVMARVVEALGEAFPEK